MDQLTTEDFDDGLDETSDHSSTEMYSTGQVESQSYSDLETKDALTPIPKKLRLDSPTDTKIIKDDLDRSFSPQFERRSCLSQNPLKPNEERPNPELNFEFDEEEQGDSELDIRLKIQEEDLTSNSSNSEYSDFLPSEDEDEELLPNERTADPDPTETREKIEKDPSSEDRPCRYKKSGDFYIINGNFKINIEKYETMRDIPYRRRDNFIRRIINIIFPSQTELAQICLDPLKVYKSIPGLRKINFRDLQLITLMYNNWLEEDHDVHPTEKEKDKNQKNVRRVLSVATNYAREQAFPDQVRRKDD